MTFAARYWRTARMACVPCVALVAAAMSEGSPGWRHQHVDSRTRVDSSCTAAFDSLTAIFHRDYPGYRDKIAGRESELAELTASARAVASTSEDHAVCVGGALQRWARFFQDPHVMIWQAAAPSRTPTPSGDGSGPGERRAIEPPPVSIDPRSPTLRFEDGTALLRLPSFDAVYQRAIDSLLLRHGATLRRTTHLIVDVRGNGGGCTCAFDALLPLLYSGPVTLSGVDIWSSEGNEAHYRSMLADTTIPESVRRRVRSVLPRLQSVRGAFVEWTPDSVVRPDSVLPRPAQIALLIDKGCASSCENLVLIARQSDKVVVMGTENTRGMLDYGNVRTLWLPGWRRLRVPTSRSRHLRDGALDGIGVAPARLIAGDADPVTAAKQLLRARSGGGE